MHLHVVIMVLVHYDNNINCWARTFFLCLNQIPLISELAGLLGTVLVCANSQAQFTPRILDYSFLNLVELKNCALFKKKRSLR